MKNKWMTTKETGQLYFERTLVMTTRPFVFICKNDEEKEYLCMELDYSIFEYAIAEVTDKMLDDMIHDKVSMEDTLRHCVGGQLVATIQENDIIRSITKDANEIIDKAALEEKIFY